jgi:hypothetical protein
VTSDKRVAGHAERRPVGWRVAIHGGGALATILLWAAATFAFGFVAFGSSVCGTATADQVRTYRLALLGYGLLVTLVPLVVGTIVRLSESAPGRGSPSRASFRSSPSSVA